MIVSAVGGGRLPVGRRQQAEQQHNPDSHAPVTKPQQPERQHHAEQ